MVMLRTIKLKILILSANITLMASCYQAFHQYFFKKNLDSEHIFFFLQKENKVYFGSLFGFWQENTSLWEHIAEENIYFINFMIHETD